MASITANTKHKVAMPGMKKVATKNPTIGIGKATKKVAGAKKNAAANRRGSIAPPLKPMSLVDSAKIAELKNFDADNRKIRITDLCRKALGEQALVDKSTPHAAPTTKDRSGAAADIAIAARELGIAFVLRECGVVNQMQRMLFPEGIESTFKMTADDASNSATENIKGSNVLTPSTGGGLKPSTSALSLSSMDALDETTTVTSGTSLGTDSKRGKTTPPNAREGSLLIIRALCETLGKKVEPFVVGAFLAAALDECGSSSSLVRAAAEDTATALVALANPWAFPCLICPLLVQSMKSTEWRVKSNALERLSQCTKTAPNQVNRLLPKLIPAVTGQLWDTKAQVTKAASSALLEICQTNSNADIKPAIPAVVNAVCKPSDTNKAVEELMGTTFVVPVDASTLSILCPVLARALKEKLAIHKRGACIVISNMSRLVSEPADVAPFGPLLVPELQKVAHNVQFEEIRDEALKALANLTKALGDSYSSASDAEATKAKKMEEEQARVEAEQKRIEDERVAEQKREEELRKKEEEERKKFKEAMDAQRELERLKEEEEKKKKEEEMKKREKAKLSTKGAAGKCQGCGLKKCKKTCLFYSGK